MRLYPPKILSAVRNLLQRKAKERRIYFSLLLQEDGVSVAAWSVDERGGTQILASSHMSTASNHWDDRIRAAERAFVQVESKVQTVVSRNVVFGLPSAMLTPGGDIQSTIRGHMKKLVRLLRLAPLGFVAIDSALAFILKQEEGVPASVILLAVGGGKSTLTVYKVGNVVGRIEREITEDVTGMFEESLKSIKNLEVLPSRILLYGSESAILESVKRNLMKYPWTTKMNFLHFPKIDILTGSRLIAAVSLAGASQLRTEMQAGVESVPAVEVHDDQPSVDEPSVAETDAENLDDNEKAHEHEAGQDDAQVNVGEDEGKDEEAEPEMKDTGSVAAQSDQNVVVVKPETLGFRTGDVLEEVVVPKKKTTGATVGGDKQKDVTTGPHERFSLIHLVSRLARSIKIPMPVANFSFPALTGLVPYLAGAVLLIAGGGLSYWLLPKATVTIFELPMEFSEEITVVIDPEVQAVDTEKGVIPGRNQAKSVSGEKTIAVTGKKKVGDPASGSVTIYNKSLTSRLFSKGTMLSYGGLRFTLDSDVAVASASENLVNGTVTFGKENATITANTIGTQGNLPTGSEFTIQDLSSSVAVARNDADLAGGTSREVTVVTRGDLDILIEELTKELVEKAKADLAASVTGTEKLIDDTIQTKNIERDFVQELDQESTELQGSLTVEVTGVSYNEDDVFALLRDTLTKRLPEGFALVEENRKLQIEDVVVAKNGTIRARAALKTAAAVTLDLEETKRKLAGKTREQAVAYLKSIGGVSAASFDIRWSIGKNRLPYNYRNISVSIALEE
jgi:hypothetical protein